MHLSIAPSILTFVWFLLAISMMATWALALLPGATWIQIVRSNVSTLTAGLVTGLVATLIAFASAQLWRPLGESTLHLVSTLLELFGTSTVSDPAKQLISTDSFSVRIAPACSGYEGIGLIEVFLAVYLWVHRASFRFTHALALMLLGAVVIWFANVIRIFSLIMIGTYISADVASGGFHSQAGWIGFNVVALGMVLLGGRLRLLSDNDKTRGGAPSSNPAAPYLMPLLTILATTIVTTGLSRGFDSLYPARVITAALVLWIYRRAYLQIDWRCSWHSVLIAAVTFLVWIALVSRIIDRQHSPLGGWEQLPAPYDWIWLAFRLIGYVIVVPIAEELAFRGYLLRRLIIFEFQELPQGRFSAISFLVSSLLFGIMHGRCWLAGTIAGMLFACSLYRRGRLADAVVAHATTNALLAGYAFYSGELWLIS
jgi:exosortase E/protease (VPEID-CTERM system)